MGKNKLKNRLKKQKKFMKRIVVEHFSHEQLLFLRDLIDYFKHEKISKLENFLDSCENSSKKVSKKVFLEDKNFKMLFENLSAEQIAILYTQIDRENTKKFVNEAYKEWLKTYKKLVKSNK